MATLTDKDPLTTPADDDLIHIVDVSDTTGSPEGTSKKITKANLGFVKNTGDETIAGVKTFSSSPIVPTPTTDLQVSTKKYVDDNVGGSPEIMIVRDEKPSGTIGGASTNGAWYTRDLNTVSKNSIAGASLSSNQITLPAGEYEIIADTPFYRSTFFKSKLYDVTNSADIDYGTSGYSYSTSYMQVSSLLKFSFTLASTTIIQLMYRIGASDTMGLGRAVNYSVPEVYSQVKITKL